MAMMKIAGRWLAQGLVITTALAMATSPLAAKTNSYGGYDIVGDTGVEESGYGDVKGWIVSKGEIGGKFAYCMAQSGMDEDAWRIGWDGMQWQVAVQYPAKAIWEGALEIDGQSQSISGTSDGSNAIAWLGMQDVVNLAKGDLMILDIGKASIDKPLNGSAAAIMMVEQCVTDAGEVPDMYIPVAEHLYGGTNKVTDRSCPDDGPRFPRSGVCMGRAWAYLNDPAEDLPIEPSKKNCEWVLNEAQLPSGWLLYKALKCGDKTATLEFSGGSNHAELVLVDGPYGADRVPVALLFARNGTVEESIMTAARDFAPGKGEMNNCRVVADLAVSSHYQIDNVIPAQAENMAARGSGPRAVCGPLGLNEDEPRFWQAMGDEVWFVQQSQDLYQSVEVMSWAIVDGK